MDMLTKGFRETEGPVTGKDFKVKWMWDGGHRFAQVGAIEVVYHSGILKIRLKLKIKKSHLITHMC